MTNYQEKYNKYKYKYLKLIGGVAFKEFLLNKIQDTNIQQCVKQIISDNPDNYRKCNIENFDTLLQEFNKNSASTESSDLTNVVVSVASILKPSKSATKTKALSKSESDALTRGLLAINTPKNLVAVASVISNYAIAPAKSAAAKPAAAISAAAKSAPAKPAAKSVAHSHSHTAKK